MRYNAWVADEKRPRKSTVPGLAPAPFFRVRKRAVAGRGATGPDRKKRYLRGLACAVVAMPGEPDSEPADPSVDTPAPTAPVPEAGGSDDWATRYKYLYADFENYRRRAERERENLSRQVRGAMIREMLPILEAFRAGRDAAARLPADHPLRKGLDLLEREWATFLKHLSLIHISEPTRP